MEEIGKKRLAAAGAVAAGLVYFLVCAVPLQKELILAPGWDAKLSAAPALPGAQAPKAKSPQSLVRAGSAADSSAPIPFRLGDRFGYFSSEGSVLFAAPAPYGVALSPDAFAAYERVSEGFSVQSPDGSVLAKVAAPGYPFFAAGRRFVIAPDQESVTELSKDGRGEWTYHFRSVATAFGASPGVAAFGLMDGSIVGLDPSGAVVLDFAPGGSRIAGVYGVAVSPDGLLVAAITGLDKQRLVVMEKRSTAYRVAYHRYLSSDYRRPVAIAFTPDGRQLLFESPSGVGIYDRAGRSESSISIPVSSKLGLTMMGGELMAFLSGEGGGKRLVCAARPDRRLVDIPLKAALAFAETSGNSLFLGLDDDIVRLDIQER
jgi:hypothetical protein